MVRSPGTECSSTIVVARTTDTQSWARASEIARRLRVPLVEDNLVLGTGSCSFVLRITDDGLELSLPSERRWKPLQLDLVRALHDFMRKGQGGRNLLIRALGGGGRQRLIVDATAGLGQDSVMMAAQGCQVIAMERSPVLVVLLKEALVRAVSHASPRVREVVGRIRLMEGDARMLLDHVETVEAPAVVYLDPMFEESPGQAASAKELRMCRRLVGEDLDAPELLVAARRVARERVVVKRRRLAVPLGPEVSMTFRGQAVRYDVYLTKRIGGGPS